MDSLKEQAEYLRLSLALSHSTIDDVVAWADGVILASEVAIPEIVAIALAVNHPADEMMKLLDIIPGTVNPEIVAHRVLVKLFERFDTSNMDLFGFLRQLCHYFKAAHVSEDEKLMYWWVDDELDLYHQGIFSMEDLLKHIEDIRECYDFSNSECCVFIAKSRQA